MADIENSLLDAVSGVENAKPVERKDSSSIKRGFGSLVAEAGQLTGSRGLKGYGERLEAENPQQVPIEEAASRPLAFTAETIGEQLPRLGVSFGSAAAGAKIGAVATGGNPLGAAAGGLIGLTLSSFLQEKAGIQREREERGLPLGTARENIGAAGAASLDVIPGVGRVLRKGATRLATGAGKEVIKAGESRLGYATREALRTGFVEAPTEGLQEYIEGVAAESPTPGEGIVEASVKGGLIGLILGGGFGGVTPRERTRKAVRDENENLKRAVEADLGVEQGTTSAEEFKRGVLSGLPGMQPEAAPVSPEEFQKGVLAGLGEGPAEPPPPPGPPARPRTAVDEALDPILEQQAAANRIRAQQFQQDVLRGLPGTEQAAAAAPVPAQAAAPAAPVDINAILDSVIPLSEPEAVQRLREQVAAETGQTAEDLGTLVQPATNTTVDTEIETGRQVKRRAKELEREAKGTPTVAEQARAAREAAHERAATEAELAKRVQEEALAADARRTRLAEAATKAEAGEKIADKVLREDTDKEIATAQKAAKMRALPSGLRDRIYRAMKLGTKANRALQIAGLGKLLRELDERTKSYEVVARLFERIAGRKFDEAAVQPQEKGRGAAPQDQGAGPVSRPGPTTTEVPGGRAEGGGAAQAAGTSQVAQAAAQVKEQTRGDTQPAATGVGSVRGAGTVSAATGATSAPAKPAERGAPAAEARAPASETKGAGAAVAAAAPERAAAKPAAAAAAAPVAAGAAKAAGAEPAVAGGAVPKVREQKPAKRGDTDRDNRNQGVTEDANREQSAAAVPARKETGTRKGVRGEDTSRGKPAGESAEEAKARPAEAKKAVEQTNTEEARKAGKGVPEAVIYTYTPPTSAGSPGRVHGERDTAEGRTGSAVVVFGSKEAAKRDSINSLRDWWGDLDWAVRNNGKVKPGKQAIIDKILNSPFVTEEDKKNARAMVEAIRQEVESKTETEKKVDKAMKRLERAARDQVKRERATAARGNVLTPKARRSLQDVIGEWVGGLEEDLDLRIGDKVDYNQGFHADMLALEKEFNNGPIPFARVAGIAALHLDDKYARALMNKIADVGIETKVQIKYIPSDPRTGGQVAGRYNDETDVIEIAPPLFGKLRMVMSENAPASPGGMSPYVFLHEAIHAVTVHKMAEGAGLMVRADKTLAAKYGLQYLPYDKMTPEQKALHDSTVEVHNLYYQAKAETEARGIEAYGFKDVNEFVAEAMTNPEFQIWLRGIEYKGRPLNTGSKARSMWGKFVDFVTGLFAADRKNAVNFFDAVLSAVPDLYRTQGMDLQPGVFMREYFQHFGETESFDSGHGQAFDKISFGMNDLTQQVTRAFEGAPNSVWQSASVVARKAALYAMTLKGIVKKFERYFPALRSYSNALDRQETISRRRNTEAAKVINKVNDWIAKHGGWDEHNPGYFDDPKSIKTIPQVFFNLMEQSTLNQIDPSLPLREQVSFEDTAEFRKLYSDISSLYARVGADGRTFFKELRDYNVKIFDDNFNAMTEAIARLYGQGKSSGLTTEQKATKMRAGDFGQDAKLAMAGLDEQYRRARGPYFHIGRYGDYFIRWQEGEGESAQHTFETFETQAQFSSRLAELVKQKKNDKSKYPAWQAGKMSERIEGLDNGSWKFVRSMLQRVDDLNASEDEKNIIKQSIRQINLQMLPETSSRKVFARRKGTPGWDRDMVRNFAKRAEIANYNLAQALSAGPVSEALEKLKKQLTTMEKSGNPDLAKLSTMGRDIETELRTRQSQAMRNPHTPVVDKITSLNYSFYLALSPAFVLMNLLQPYQLTLPLVGARHGFTKTALEMAKSAGTAFKVLKAMLKTGVRYPNLEVDKLDFLTADQKTFLKQALDSGRIDITLAHEINNIRKHGATSRFDRVMHVLGLGSHYTEVQNRVTAGLMAFNLARKSGASMEKAVRYGTEIIDSTQMDYSAKNLARLMGKHGIAGGFTPIFMAFQRYNAQTLELNARLVMESFGGLRANTAEAKEARRALLGLFATTASLAGMLGLPAMGLITAMIDKLFGDEDRPLDIKAEFRNHLAELFGKETAEIIARGGPRAMGFDLSQRVGFDNMIPFTRLIGDKRQFKDMLEAQAIDLMGPVMGGVTNMVYGASQVADGDVMKGFQKMMPLAPLRNVAKASEAAGGYVTDSKGNKIPIALNGWDTMVTLLGLTPSKVAERSEALYAINTNTRQLQQRASHLRQKWYRALEQNDPARAAEVRAEMIQFNLQNPGFAISGLAQGYARRAKIQTIAERVGPGVGVSSLKNLPRLNIGQFANIERDQQ